LVDDYFPSFEVLFSAVHLNISYFLEPEVIFVISMQSKEIEGEKIFFFFSTKGVPKRAHWAFSQYFVA
jgi:hypothetical protein